MDGGGADVAAGVEEGDPAVGDRAVRIDPHDADLDDPVGPGFEPGGLDVDDGEREVVEGVAVAAVGSEDEQGVGGGNRHGVHPRQGL